MQGFLIDTDILSIFAKADALPILCCLFRCERLPITLMDKVALQSAEEFGVRTVLCLPFAFRSRPGYNSD